MKHTVNLGHEPEEEALRDAVHVAVIPVRAGKPINPGEKVSMVDGVAVPTDSSYRSVGVADPFLGKKIKEKQMFWLFLTPNTITGMRHHWSHPSFEDEVKGGSSQEQVDESAAWVDSYAKSLDLDYDTLMNAAENYMDTGEMLIGGGNLEGKNTPDEFWNHFEIITGRRAPRDNFFSCAC